ncbi:MAG: aspartate kinase [Cytophagales bacterium]|nr:aspartate kinase [Cytophagales bacterium]
MRIFKFGGASVKNAAAIRNLQDILSNYADEKLFVVVSAMGKTTNKLEHLAKLGFAQKPYEMAIHEIEQEHIEISEELLGEVPAPIKKLFASLANTVARGMESWPEYYDQVVSHGELLSTSLIVQFLKRTMPVEWLDARDFIATSEHYMQAKVDIQATKENISAILASEKTFLTQGFIGRSANGKSTTLGREGSDYSAALFANFLQADELVVWKDVPGIMTADPKLSSEVKQYDRLTYRRAVEMTYYGAKVIHPKTMGPLAKANIPMTVRSFLDLNQKGTLITSDEALAEEVLPSMVYRYDQVLVSLRIPDGSTIDHLLMSEVMQDLSQLEVQINLMQHSALSFSFCLDEDKAQLENMRGLLGRKYSVLENNGLHLVTFMNYEKGKGQTMPAMKEIFLEQRTRHHHRILYRP